MRDWIESFFLPSSTRRGPLHNERALQLELGLHLRSAGLDVEFERPCEVIPLPGSVRSNKLNCDIMVHSAGNTSAIELKLPLNGRHPETLFDFCKDIAFIEGVVRGGFASQGFCLFVTNDHTFWQDSGRGSAIHDIFRKPDSELSGVVQKPTGTKDASVALRGRYVPANWWKSVSDARLISNAKYLLVKI